MTQEEAKEKILLALPYMRHAVEKAAAEGSVEVGILATQPSGAGRIVARFQAAEFFEDLATALGVGELTEAERLDAKAQAIVDAFAPLGRIVDQPAGSLSEGNEP